MASSLRHTCGSCVRYLSPTRVNNVHARRQHELRIGQVRWHSAPSSPSRWRSSVNLLAQRSQREDNISNSNGEQVMSASHAPTHENQPGTDSKKTGSNYLPAGGLKNAREWTMDSISRLDPRAIRKIMSVLNIDFPKYQKYLTSTTKMISFSNDGDLDRVKKQQLEEKRARLMKKMEDQQNSRESHDFEEAMTSTMEGIQNYYYSETVNSNVTSTTTIEPTSPKTEENTQAKFLDKMSRFTQILPGGDKDDKDKDKVVVSKEVMVARKTVDRRTRGLVYNVRNAGSDPIRLNRLEDLCLHLSQYTHFAKNVAIKEGIVPLLMRLRESNIQEISEYCNQALCLVGHVNPVKGRGIRILTIDGGGTRGLVALDMMRQIEASTGQPIHKLFDYVCGVSTGALIAAIIGIYKSPIDECERIYKQFSREMFDRSRLLGASKLVTTHAYYDSNLWENILKENVGLGTFIETMKDRECPKCAMVSTLVNQQHMENFLFRNYTHATGLQSKFQGSIKHAVWEAIRASSAAPGYYEEKKLDQYIHQDGGLLTNNPAAIAIHESKMLWPHEDIQCVISLGTGRFRPTEEPTPSYRLKDKLLKVVQSATDTEAVHTVLLDLLPPSTYFRFNPYLSDNFMLDEINEESWEVMKQDSIMYSRKNNLKFDAAAQQLLLSKRPHQKAVDWVKGHVEKYT